MKVLKSIKMQISQSAPKILKTELTELLTDKDWLRILLEEGLYEFEQQLYEAFMNLYDRFVSSLLENLSQTKVFKSVQRSVAKDKGLKKLAKRFVQLQLRTGTKIRFESLYAKKVPKQHQGTRHLSLLVLRTSNGMSPTYKSICCLLSVLCPSFDVAKEVLRHQGIHANFNRVRSAALSFADEAIKNRVGIQLEVGENMKGKHVVIATDGGRTRMKEYKNKKASKREQEFDTPWREPKLFIITTYDEQGRINKTTKPIYDGTFGDEEMVEFP